MFITCTEEKKSKRQKKDIVATITFEKMQKQPPEFFYNKPVLKNFAIFTGKQLSWSLFLI